MPVAVGGAGVVAVLAAGNLTGWGRFATAYLFVVLDFYIGVITLVSLSLTVMAGLISADRIMLHIGHRVLFQGIHRATSIIAVIALGIHIAVKVLEAHAGLGDAIVPFFSQGRSRYIGFGTIAGYLMLLASWSGLARTRFIGTARPWLWRTLHCAAYLSWPVALAHGLNAGRAAATWVTVSYIACVVGVALALLVRLYTRFGRYSLGTRSERPAGLNTQAAFVPKFQDGPRLSDGVSVRAPVTAPRSAVDAAETAYYEPTRPVEHADAGYAGGDGRPAWSGEWGGPSYRDADYRDPYYPDRVYQEEAYPDAAYQSGPPAEAYHDYWSEADQSREIPFGRWEPEQERPRLRLITNDEAPDGPRQPATGPRRGRGQDAEGYRAG